MSKSVTGKPAKANLHYFTALLKRLGIAMLLYTLLRLAFYGMFAKLFPAVGFWQLAGMFALGLRFDLSAILYVNVVVLVLHLLPVDMRSRPWWRRLTKICFYAFNAVALLFALADFGYFRYAMKRSDGSIFSYGFDIGKLLQQFVADYWYLLIVGLLLWLPVEWLYRKTERTPPEHLPFFPQFLLFLLAAALTVLGMRGGLQLRPLKPIQAARFVEPAFIPLVVNTPFNIIQTLRDRGVPALHYFPPGELEELFEPYQTVCPADSGATKRNLCIIMLESMSRSYTNLDGGESYTPFLDSLMRQGMVCTNAFANGKQSNQAMSSILAALPALMDKPYLASVYQGNRLRGLGDILKRNGYGTAFFHGANNGSFQIDVFSQAAGFGQFYGRNEYGDDSDFDGNWGIFDEPFLRYTAREMGKLARPFGVGVFTLSAHYPFALPAGCENRFKKGPLPMNELIGYSDFALRAFFEEAKKTDWYDNTLFVVTADHTGPAANEYESKRVGLYRIPILYFLPDGSLASKTYGRVTQQSDIMPSVLHLLGCGDEFTAFGQNVFADSCGRVQQRYAYNYINGVYQILDDSLSLHFDGEKVLGLYRYQTDSLLNGNLLRQPGLEGDRLRLETRLKAVLQTYNALLRNNKLVPE